MRNLSMKKCELISAMTGLAKAAYGSDSPARSQAEDTMLQAFIHLDDSDLADWIQKVNEAKNAVAPDCAVCACPCGRTSPWDASLLLSDPDEALRMSRVELLSLMQDISLQAQEIGLDTSSLGAMAVQVVFYIAMYRRVEDMAIETEKLMALKNRLTPHHLSTTTGGI